MVTGLLMKRSVAAAYSTEPDHDGLAAYDRRIDLSSHPAGHSVDALAPGSPLRSDQLRARYDVGISPLREALTRLVSERLVTSVGQRGFRVAPLTAYDVEDTMMTRIVIEREASRVH
jgi:hypothetical protein